MQHVTPRLLLTSWCCAYFACTHAQAGTRAAAAKGTMTVWTANEPRQAMTSSGDRGPSVSTGRLDADWMTAVPCWVPCALARVIDVRTHLGRALSLSVSYERTWPFHGCVMYIGVDRVRHRGALNCSVYERPGAARAMPCPCAAGAAAAFVRNNRPPVPPCLTEAYQR